MRFEARITRLEEANLQLLAACSSSKSACTCTGITSAATTAAALTVGIFSRQDTAVRLPFIGNCPPQAARTLRVAPFPWFRASH